MAISAFHTCIIKSRNQETVIGTALVVHEYLAGWLSIHAQEDLEAADS